MKPDLADTGYRVSFQERCQIEAMKEAGMTLRAIAARLGRAPSTISREVARNKNIRGRGDYSARNAQHKAEQPGSPAQAHPAGRAAAAAPGGAATARAGTLAEADREPAGDPRRRGGGSAGRPLTRQGRCQITLVAR